MRGGEKGIAQIEFDKVDHRGRPLKYVMITKPCKNLARNNTVSINDPNSVLCARDRIYRRSVFIVVIDKHKRSSLRKYALETGQIEFDKLDPPLGSVMNDAVSVLEQGERFRFRPENRIEAGSSCELELSE